MAATDTRLVVAFFSGENQSVQDAAATMRRLYPREKVEFDLAGAPAAPQKPASELRMPDEGMLSAWLPVPDLGAAIQTLQSAHASSIFLTGGGKPAPECAGRLEGVKDCNSLLKALGELERAEAASRDYLVQSVGLGHPASPAAQWAMDNAYLVQMGIKDIRTEVRKSLKRMPTANLIELLALAKTFLHQAANRVSDDLFRSFLTDVQVTRELDSEQLWSFPLIVRVVLIDELVTLSCRCSRIQQLREEAFLWADRIAHSFVYGGDLPQAMIQRMGAEPFAKDRSFAVALAEQLQEQESPLQTLQTSIESRLGASLSELVRAEHQRESEDSLLAASAFGSLRVIGQIKYRETFEVVSRADTELWKDPSGIYAKSDFNTRDHCRLVVSGLSRRAGVPESEVARTAVRLSEAATGRPENQLLHYLLGDGIGALEKALRTKPTARQRTLRFLRRHAVPLYLSSIVILTACFTFVALNLAWDAGIRQRFVLLLLGSLVAFPLSELAMQTVNSLVVSIFPPEFLPKLDLSDGIPEDAATLVVVPMMLTSVETVRRELEKLEIRFLANRLERLTFSLFSDFTDAPQREAESDDLLLGEAKNGIAALNHKYGANRFVLFHRERVWSESEQAWIGRERKRGKIEDLNAFLVGETGPGIVAAGEAPKKIQYVITLDADTQLPPGAALRMIETIAHPMNRVEIDARTGIRKRGYSIIQPRVSIALPGASASRFTQIFSDAQGTDPYSFVVSDAHQDMFSEAMFHGKALYDVAAFHKIVGHRFPDDTLLSHDLIEGAHAGVALASDIEVLENLPLDYPAFARRQHRWIRGDWQIAPWVLGRVPSPDGQRQSNPLSLINRWRILDNLRRSIVPVASLLLLVFGWFVSAVPGVWTIVLGLAVVTPALVPVLDRWSRHMEGTVYGWRGAADDLKRAFVGLAFLPHQAWVNTDAIVRALHRSLISKRRVLEWQTAADDARKDRAKDPTTRQVRVIAGLSGAALVILALEGAFGPTFWFLGLWISSPWLMEWLGRPAPAPRRERIGREDSAYLRGMARSTWRYFDDLIGPDTNWLPPDNSQLALRIEVAQRTSPTNVGLWLNAAQAARDFGYITTDEFVRRSQATFDTIAKLERYEGHLLNWYDTRTLAPLPPKYVSTVDSGNLIASLWVMVRGCDELAESPILNSSLEGLADSIELLRALTGKDPSLAVALDGLKAAVREGAPGIERISRLRLAAYYITQLKQAQRWQAGSGDEKTYWALKLASELEAWVGVIDRYLRWMELLSEASDEALFALGPTFVQLRRDALKDVPSMRTLTLGTPLSLAGLLAKRNTPELRPELATWLEAVNTEYQAAKQNAAETLGRLRELAEASNNLASEINMAFLYDPARRLFGTGYTVGSPMTFSSHYDLLASECRVASLVAIAKGEVPVEHWFVLGRARIATPSRQALLSWSGTMFEYLMPVLFTETFENSLLAEAVGKAVDAQMSYGTQHKMPWGISECAYSALDSNQIYQYRAFGIPDLALNPDADPGPVVAPYASALALMVDPIRAIANLKRLEKEGATGSMGFYDAIDYTRPRREGKPGVVIFTYMVHHQAMSLLALSNTLSKRAVQRRFHADPRIKAVESLLCERIPITRVEPDEVFRAPKAPAAVSVQERIWTSRTPLPHVHLNSNGRYTVMVTNNGGGYSKWNGLDITRWRSDTARDQYGSLLWIRDLKGGAAWSPGLGLNAPGEGSATFSADHAEFRRQVNELEAKLEVAVATDDDAELRRLTLSNRSLRTRSVEITSYMELALAAHAADCAHPAFAKMFVETEAPERGVLIAYRRPRSEADPPVWVACVMNGANGSVEYETDRAVFVGRGREASNPAALQERLSGNTGAVLDPIFSFRVRCSLEPRQHTEIALVTLAAASRDELMTLVRKYQGANSLAHAFEMVWTRAQLEFRYLRIGAASAHRFEELAGHLLYPSPMLRPNPARLARNNGAQSDLWRYGISGDLPIMAVTAADLQAVSLIRELLLAHAYLRMSGLEVDLVILNHEEGGYQTPLQDVLTRLVQVQVEDHRPGAQGGKIFLLNWRELRESDRDLLLGTARVVLGGHLGPLQQQLLRSVETPAIAKAPRKAAEVSVPAAMAPIADLKHANGLGGFSADGREYVIDMGPRGQKTPAPWANVLANESFGTVVTESGLGFTWNGNSQRNRLTPWHNDPVSDPQSEVVYLRDDDSGVIWTPTALPVREAGSAYRVRHGQGYSTFEHNSQGIEQELTVFVGLQDPVKICLVRLTNASGRPRSLTVTHFAEWVLGSVREQQQVHVKSRYDEATGVMLAHQTWTSPYDGQVAFCASSSAVSSYTADRISFFGGSTPVMPGSLEAVHLDRRSGGGLDPCSALQVKVTIPAGAMREVVFVLGQAENEEKALKLAQKFRDPRQARKELDEVRKWWDEKLSVIQISTPVSTANLLMNRWLLYQSLACRFWGRSALYQSGGAMGFRDQLQDCAALAYAAPELTRAHILKAAERQYHEGDVQHWWHAESGLGVRTRCSDDMLWLPWTVARYMERTGDVGILDEQLTFLEGAELEPKEHDRLSTPAQSAHTESLWEHCRLAIERGSRFGAHGLPLMGDGDWNDGMNLVGAEGRGESVWLAWFLLAGLNDWIPIARKRAPEVAAAWDQREKALHEAIEKNAWDGEWYVRAFFDDGSPLGSKTGKEAQIDSISQSWGVLSGYADPERSAKALASVEKRLVHPQDELIQLLTPPFDVSTPHPGYIMGYPPGVRENGGQYTHGALWLCQAHARMGDGAGAVRLLQFLNPAEHTLTGSEVAKYRGEPYAVAADVSYSPGREGRSGWTWYTGSAGWMYRIWLEDVLGFQLRGDRLRMAPAIPEGWGGFDMTYRYKSSRYEIHVLSGKTAGVVCDGKVCEDGWILLRDDGATHTVSVTLGVSVAEPVGALTVQ